MLKKPILVAPTGEKLFTNKIITGMDGSKFIFADGSWFDINSKEIHDAGGKGEIRLETIPVGFGSFRYTPKRVVFRHVSITMNVVMHDGSDTVLDFTGDSELVEQIVHRMDGDQLIIEEKPSEDKSNQIDIVGRNSVVFVNGQTISNQQSARPKAAVLVKIPKHTSLHFDSVDGDIDCSELDIPVYVSYNGTGRAHFRKIKDVFHASLIGAGEVIVEQVDNADAILKLIGSGDILIRKGQLNSLVASLTGSGDITVNAAVSGNAQLNLVGSGDIMVVGMIGGNVHRSCVGTGDIIVNALD